ncbi:class I SAM-dependent methyltransferase [Thiomicrorhabdus sp. Kp2]|uniref:class I SAM-dependent methyltransferase n=1 Tax=Thiomicrorhabdus sp. Kp2 TaxID=1123518 RepID=UPI000410BE20|nr:class I SAM-dependent methyltransferase [Thiomicrorhabdus sp. Kp2]
MINHSNTAESLCIANTYPEKAKALSDLLGLPICHNQSISSLWLDWLSDKKDPTIKLSLCSDKQGPVSIDFLGGKKAHRRQFGGGKGQPLVRAMGQITQNETSRLPTIIDATAGMGGDSYVLASLGFKVQMIERSPIVAALLNDALERANNPTEALDEEMANSIQNLSLVNADSAQYLLDEKPDIDVIYMDPMYPEKKKKAAAKKEMQALQQLVGPDTDSENLLAAALQTAKYRVVVKRPKGAVPVFCPINNIQPSSQVSSPNTRYDIYVIKALKASNQL